MTIDQLRATHQATPFRPFTIFMADGQTFEIPHREFLSHSPGGRTVIVYGPDDSFHILDLLLMTQIKVHEPKTSGGDGTHEQ